MIRANDLVEGVRQMRKRFSVFIILILMTAMLCSHAEATMDRESLFGSEPAEETPSAAPVDLPVGDVPWLTDGKKDLSALYGEGNGEAVVNEMHDISDSEMIAAMGYDSAQQKLTVRMRQNGETRIYAGVPEALYVNFSQSDIKDKFFSLAIDGRYDRNDVTFSVTPVSSGMRLLINGREIAVAWEDNAAVTLLKDLVSREDITISMTDYGGFQKVGMLGWSIPSAASTVTAEAGDIVLYSGNQVFILYGSSEWMYTRLGKITGVGGDGLQDLLGSGDVTITFTK